MQNNNAIDPVESQAQYDTYTQLQYLIQFAKKNQTL
jgi:hypothetical protein